MEGDKLVVARLPPIDSANNSTQFVSPRSLPKYDGLTGPRYTLAGQNVPYNLPPRTVLKPHQDTKAGSLDTWPAHATGMQTSVVLTKDKQLRLIDEEASGKGSIMPKPKFLEQLENFLKKELKALGVSDVQPSELRLQAHREVFEYLVEDFKTYKPMLSAIKNEYEMMLAYQQASIRQLEPLKQMLVTVSEQCDQKVMSLREEEKQEIADLKNENKNLYRKIDQLKQDQSALEMQVEKCQEELAAEYLRYRDECDARKMLVVDINDLRYQQEDTLLSKQSIDELDLGDKDDPITLKIALKKCRQDEAAASQRLMEMEANYGDVIPRRDFETLNKEHVELEEKMSQLQDDFSKLQAEHDILLEKYRQVVQQRDEYYVESENLRRSATPRPDWNRCADHVAGGILRWKELSAEKTSDQLVDILLSEISGSAGSDSAGAEYFEGQGKDPTVPKYLQWEGKVRNRRLGKRDCALLIKDIWREKVAHSAEGTEENLADFLHTYLQRRFGIEQMIVEWAYNLHDACQRYSHDDRIAMFYNILSGQADENLYHNQLQMTSRLLNELTKVDVDRGNLGSLSKDDIQAVFTSYFADRDEERIEALMRSAEVQLDSVESDVLEYKLLFMEDDEGKTGAFIDEVIKQSMEDRITYVDEIKAELDNITPVSVMDLKKAITIIDPEIDQPELEAYLSWSFSVSIDKLDGAAPVELSTLTERLRNGNLHRIGSKQ